MNIAQTFLVEVAASTAFSSLSQWHQNFVNDLITRSSCMAKLSSKQVTQLDAVMNKVLPYLAPSTAAAWHSNGASFGKICSVYESPPSSNRMEYLGNFVFRLIPAHPFNKFKDVVTRIRSNYGYKSNGIKFDYCTSTWILSPTTTSSRQMVDDIIKELHVVMDPEVKTIYESIGDRAANTKFYVQNGYIEVITFDPFVGAVLTNYRRSELIFHVPMVHSDVMVLIRLLEALNINCAGLFAYTNYTSPVLPLLYRRKIDHAIERNCVVVGSPKKLTAFLNDVVDRVDLPIEIISVGSNKRPAITSKNVLLSATPSDNRFSIVWVEYPRPVSDNDVVLLADAFMKPGPRIIASVSRIPHGLYRLDDALSRANNHPAKMEACDVIHL